tara:strand:- start:1027 stop:1188 length:162 start_codon:yes stop_codon:yes gene_type:complete
MKKYKKKGQVLNKENTAKCATCGRIGSNDLSWVGCVHNLLGHGFKKKIERKKN